MQIQKINNQTQVKNSQSRTNFKGTNEQRIFQETVREAVKKTNGDFFYAMISAFEKLKKIYKKTAEVYAEDNFLHFVKTHVSKEKAVINEDMVVAFDPNLKNISYKEFRRYPDSLGSQNYKGHKMSIDYSYTPEGKIVENNESVSYEGVFDKIEDFNNVIPKASMKKSTGRTIFMYRPEINEFVQDHPEVTRFVKPNSTK